MSPWQAVLWVIPTSGSASELRATDKTLEGVEGKNKVIIARFDIGVALLLSEIGAVWQARKASVE